MEDIWSDKSRKPVRISVKKQVYKRAKGKCEKCKKEKLVSPDTKSGFKGHYHHVRSPHISPTAKTVRLLCPNCHEKYGHSRKTVKRDDFFETYTVTKVKRHEVVKLGKKKKPKTKRVAIRDSWTGEITGYRPVNVKTPPKKASKTKTTATKKKPAPKKKKTTKRKTTRKTTSGRKTYRTKAEATKARKKGQAIYKVKGGYRIRRTKK